MEKLETKINRANNLKWIILGAILGILLEIILTASAILAGNWQKYRVLDLGSMISKNELELTDCTLEDGSILSKDANAMLIFHKAEDWGQLRLTFSEPVLEAATVEWYNSPQADDSFDRFRCKQGYIMPETKEASITLPIKDNGNLRLNIHGNFRLESIAVTERISGGGITPKLIFLHINWVRMIAFAFFGISGLCLYGRERKQKSICIENAEKQENRYVYLDGIRVLAAMLVIVVHVIEPLALLYPMGSKRYVILRLLSAVSLNCNLLFVMISGALLLGWKEEGWGEFFKKRFLKVLLPLAVYGMFYLKGCCISKADLISWISYGIQTFISGDFVKGRHLWLIYVLLGLYITVIPFRYMLREMKEDAKKALAIVILLCLLVDTIGKLIGIEVGISAFLGSWAGIFIMGYLINQPWMRKYDIMLLIAGVIALAVSGWVVKTHENCMEIIANQSILSMLMSAAIFATFLRGDKLLALFGRFLAVVSRYSYSIILIHWYILIRVVYNGYFSSHMSQYLQVVLPIIWCILLSVAAAWVIDRFIVDVLLEGLERLQRLLSH